MDHGGGEAGGDSQRSRASCSGRAGSVAPQGSWSTVRPRLRCHSAWPCSSPAMPVGVTITSTVAPARPPAAARASAPSGCAAASPAARTRRSSSCALRLARRRGKSTWRSSAAVSRVSKARPMPRTASHGPAASHAASASTASSSGTAKRAARRRVRCSGGACPPAIARTPGPARRRGSPRTGPGPPGRFPECGAGVGRSWSRPPGASRVPSSGGAGRQ